MTSNSHRRNNRLNELDFARGLAIVFMTIFHLIVDLTDVYSYNLEYLQGFWYWVGKAAAVLFIFLCGLSSTFSHDPTGHGIHIFMWGMVLTAITYVYNSDFYIHFGILHFLGTSLLLSPLAAALKPRWLAIVSASAFIMGILLTTRFTDIPYLFPLGLQTQTFTSLDYYPLFPWYGFFAAGIFCGKTCYEDRQPLFSLSFPQPVLWLGQHSLAIYLLHQPILLAILYGLHQLLYAVWG